MREGLSFKSLEKEYGSDTAREKEGVVLKTIRVRCAFFFSTESALEDAIGSHADAIGSHACSA
jgi:hypothetical protein